MKNCIKLLIGVFQWLLCGINLVFIEFPFIYGIPMICFGIYIGWKIGIFISSFFI